MIAHRTYHCNCGCDTPINPGDKFRIENGFFYHDSHSSNVNIIELVPPSSPPKRIARGTSKKAEPVISNAVQLSLFDQSN